MYTLLAHIHSTSSSNLCPPVDAHLCCSPLFPALTSAPLLPPLIHITFTSPIPCSLVTTPPKLFLFFVSLEVASQCYMNNSTCVRACYAFLIFSKRANQIHSSLGVSTSRFSETTTYHRRKCMGRTFIDFFRSEKLGLHLKCYFFLLASVSIASIHSQQSTVPIIPNSCT
jgi:hypothetical protein